ncbi:MAG: efflux RND transporter periplasmic adaptor subunit [Pirellulales bacterium]|nr:efflux RND transporter periplasmic adaptor subunit [Pirellulales bacterium]
MLRHEISRIFLVASLLALPASATLAQLPVRAATVEMRPMQQRHAVTGSIRAVARGDLAALESGRLIELVPRAGHLVKKGHVLARVDARRLEAEKKTVEADLEVARADLASRQAIALQTQTALGRAERLLGQNATSRHEFEVAEANARVAHAEVQSAQQRILRIKESIALIDVRLSDTVVQAPYDATVVERHAEPGDWLQPGDTLLTLVSSGPVEAWLEVPERYVESLRSYGDEVVVRARAANRDLKALSFRRVADVNRRVRTISFVVTLANEDDLLTPGMSVDAWIAVSGQSNRMSVPKDAVIRHNGETYVFRVDKKRLAEKVPVRVLFETTERIAVAAAGLNPGDQVIVEGNERLLSGQAVAVTRQQQDVSTLAKR